MNYHDIKKDRLKAYQSRSDIVSVSSDSKWHYVFEELEGDYEKDTKVEVKFLTEESCFEYKCFFSSLFEETYLDGMSGPVSYSQIEWIKVYSVKLPRFVKEVEVTAFENGFKIYGYKRSDA